MLPRRPSWRSTSTSPSSAPGTSSPTYEKNHIVGPYNGGGPREILIPHNTDLPSGQRRTYEADQQMQALIDEYRSTHDGREPRVRTYGCSCTTILIILFAIMIIASIFGH